MAGTTFTTLTSPSTPSITSPANSSTNISRNPTITSSAFVSAEGLTHTSSTWQLATDSGFSSVVWSKSADTTNKTSIVVNATNGTFAGALSGQTELGLSTAYYVRVKYTDSESTESAYSSTVTFTTRGPTLIQNSVDVQSPWDKDLIESAAKPSTVGIVEQTPTDAPIDGTVRILDSDESLAWYINSAWHYIFTLATLDTRYVNTSGDTMTGVLNFGVLGWMMDGGLFKFIDGNDATLATEGGTVSATYKIYGLGDSLSDNTWQPYLETTLGASWDVVDAGVGSDTTALILARYEAEILNKADASYVVIMAGVNDIHTDVPAATTKANLQAIYTAIHKTGAKVVACTVMPYATTAKLSLVQALNTWIKGTATDIDYIVDTYTAVDDPANPGNLLPAYDGGDHTHLSAAGYEHIADVMNEEVEFTDQHSLILYSPSALNQPLLTTSSPTFATGTFGTINSTVGTISAITASTANISLGTISTLVASTANIGLGTFGTLIGTVGTIPSFTASTANITLGTFGVGSDAITLNKDQGIRFSGTTTNWEDMMVYVSRSRTGPLGTFPTWGTFNGAEVLEFNDGTVNSISFTTQVPHSAKVGGSVEYHVHVSPVGTEAGTVVWQMTHSWAPITGSFPTASTITGTQIIASNSNNTHMLYSLGYLGTNPGISSMLMCSLARIGTATEDNFGTIRLLQSDFHYEVDAIGSDGITSKT